MPVTSAPGNDVGAPLFSFMKMKVKSMAIYCVLVNLRGLYLLLGSILDSGDSCNRRSNSE